MTFISLIFLPKIQIKPDHDQLEPLSQCPKPGIKYYTTKLSSPKKKKKSVTDKGGWLINNRITYVILPEFDR